MRNIANHTAKQCHSEARNVNNFKLFCYIITCILTALYSHVFLFSLSLPSVAYQLLHDTLNFITSTMFHMFGGFVLRITWIIIYIKCRLLNKDWMFVFTLLYDEVGITHTHTYTNQHEYGLHLAVGILCIHQFKTYSYHTRS